MKYMTVYENLKNKIQTDIYQDGQKIPSLRILAKNYMCSIETIKHALQLLLDEELIYSKNRSGFYVLQKNKIIVGQIESKTIDFSSSKANETTFPYADFQKCLTKATENYKPDFFAYGTAQGLPELITTLKNWLATQQIYVKSENLFITTGVQQALFILSRLKFPNNKTNILIEAPSYHLMNAILKTENIPYFTIDRDETGINWTLLEYYFKEKSIKFFYTTSRISSPLGLSYSEQEKKQLVELANKYDVYLIEDDYLADYVETSLNLPLHYYDTNERVIYLKSFSKIMFPGLRIGACILPSSLTNSFQLHRVMLEIDSSMFSQAALNLYIKSGMFDTHIEKTQKLQKERNRSFIHAVNKNETRQLFALNNFETYKTFLKLPSHASKTLFEAELKKENIHLNNISKHFLNQKEQLHNLYGLELLNPTPNQITIGINKIFTAYEKAIR